MLLDHNHNCVQLLLLLLNSLTIDSNPVSSWRPKHTRCDCNSHKNGRHTTPDDISASIATITNAVAFAWDGKQAEPSRNRRNSIAAVDTGSGGDICTTPRPMVIFRAPSRHTYGFASENSDYDLPKLELHNLLSSMTACDDDRNIRFIPVEGSLHRARPGGDDDQAMVRTPKSKNQSKKKVSKQPQHAPSLYWIECANGISAEDIAKATSRAILTHATFSIQESVSFSEKDWVDALDHCSGPDNGLCRKIVETMEMIDMGNPNMSRDDRTQLIERVSCLIVTQHPKIQSRLGEHFPGVQPILIYSQQPQNSRQPSCYHEQTRTHHLYFGRRTAIGPAGTKGAPSLTLRRTHRGLLKEYALKNRMSTTNNDANDVSKSVTSTQMEPEIGFLLCSLAIAGIDTEGKKKVSASVLDPCCGSGSLLLYAAALGAENVVGVDYNPSVWKDAEIEFRRHACAINSLSTLAVPKFFQGDVRAPSSTEALCSPNSFDAIVCDPPYNVGAPVLVDGKDMRPRNYHSKNSRHGNTCCFFNESLELGAVPTDLVSHILAIARRVLVNGGRLVFFLPVKGQELTMPLEEVLMLRGCNHWEVSGGGDQGFESHGLRLLKHIARLQHFSPTFSRWLVCMEKC